MVQGPDDAARQVDRRRKQRRPSRRAGVHQPQLREEEGDDRHGEDLEETFDPKMDHPPTPILDDGQGRVLPPHKPRAVKERDGRRGEDEQAEERSLLVGSPQGRKDGPDHQEQPQEQSPKSAACQTRPRSTYSYPWCPHRNEALALENLWNTLAHSPASDPTTTRTSAPKRAHTPMACPFGSPPPTTGPMKRPEANQARGDPEEAQLNVPSPRHDVGQPLVQGESVETVPFHAVVGRDDSHPDLRQQQPRHNQEIGKGCFLGRSRRETSERILFRDRVDVMTLPVFPCVEPHQ
jgi:hypothetical protein